MYKFVMLLRTKPPQSTHFLNLTLANKIQYRILKCRETSLNEENFLLLSTFLLISVSLLLWTASGAQSLNSHGQPYMKGQWKKNYFLCSQTTRMQVIELSFMLYLQIIPIFGNFHIFSRLTSVMGDITSPTIRRPHKRKDMPILLGNGHIGWSSGSSYWLLRS